MGNTSSNVTSGVKKQADAGSLAIYQLADLKGGGQLVALMKETTKTKQFEELENKIREMVEPFLYNGGLGKQLSIADLVLHRNKDRPKHKQLADPRTSATDEENNTKEVKGGDVNGVANQKNGTIQYREVCWRLDQLGAVGESIIHLCLLNSTSVHADLAKRLIKMYPKLINDIYMCDEYYGENVLHMAIVNEDPAMVKFLLDNDVDYHGRCIGNFFCPEDQKDSREDSLEHEWVKMCVNTNYEGYVYWGEYPLSFAACLGQEECYRLVLAKGADPDMQDTNGNTVLHMLVIHEKMNMFNMAYEMGANMEITNLQGLTPLTLAAKLARKDMFFYILKLEREIYWQIGGIMCAAYPLQRIDTIDPNTGEIDNVSALNLIVYGDKEGHLDMMDGMIMDLLNAKWNSFVKFKFYKSFAMFCIYFLFSITCFVTRPVPGEDENILIFSASNGTNATTANATFANVTSSNGTFSNCTSSCQDPCYLWPGSDSMGLLRWVIEGATCIGAILYLIGAGREASFLGYQLFVENMKTVPSRVLFMFSCILCVVMIPLRLACASEAEDIVAVLVMMTTAPFFLFFCRGFKIVGPFVVMVYKMIMGDLLRFVTIYTVFVLGFSQAYFIIFLTHHGRQENNYFQDPVESVLAMFIMSLQEFGDIYNEFDYTNYPYVSKILFIMYMALVAMLLVNMLIAMMGNTYQIIAETRNEWQRQWARIVLVGERGVHPKERLRNQVLYSQQMADGRRAFILRMQQTEEDREEIKEILEIKTYHIKNVKRRAKGSNIMSTPVSSPREFSSSNPGSNPSL